MYTLLLATHNRGKVEEFAGMLQDLAVQWLSLDDVGVTMEVEETGKTFAENAVMKAMAYADVTGLLTLADDSGLEVDALDGQPGVHTARFGGPGLTPEQRYRRLLALMEGVPTMRRTARFRCAIALATRGKLLGTADGLCEGAIAFGPAGAAGFGYDPVFLLPDRGLTMAQLTENEKRWISHRGRAVAAAMPLLMSALQEYGRGAQAST